MGKKEKSENKEEKLTRIDWLLDECDTVVSNSPIMEEPREKGYSDGYLAAWGSITGSILSYLLNRPEKEKEILGTTYQEYLGNSSTQVDQKEDIFVNPQL